jgi:hypothetical protein
MAAPLVSVSHDLVDSLLIHVGTWVGPKLCYLRSFVHFFPLARSLARLHRDPCALRSTATPDGGSGPRRRVGPPLPYRPSQIWVSFRKPYVWFLEYEGSQICTGFRKTYASGFRT